LDTVPRILAATLRKASSRASASIRSERIFRLVNGIDQGVVSVADVDTALCWGPGLRWGIMGQVLLNHLGGGQGGIEHFFQQFTGPLTAWWKVLGSPTLTSELQRKLIDGVHAEVGSRSIDELAAERDELLLGLLELRTKPAKPAVAPK
jgi:3-hydroxyacyl-CoA dehydrogenase, C-terminal domain